MNKLKLFIKAVSALMVVAFIVGIVSFVRANNSGELKNLYKEAPLIAKEIEKDIDVEDFSRGEINPEPLNIKEIEVQDLKNIELKKVEKSKEKTLKVKPRAAKKSIKKDRMKRKTKVLNIKSFSRGSLERMPRPIIKTDETIK